VPPTHQRRHLELLGLGLGVVGSAWFVVAAGVSGGRPLLLIAPFAGTIVAVLGAGRLPRRASRPLLLLLTAAPVLTALASRRSLLGDGPLGYANASAALFVIAATAAIVIAISSEQPLVRRAAIAAAVLWLLAPWITGAFTAALAGVGVAIIAGSVPDVRARTIVRVAGLAAIALFVAVTVVGAAYVPGPRTSLADRAIDASMGELRVVLWHEATEMIAEAPLTGVGPGRFADESPSAAERDDANWAHNEFLQVAAESGVPGALLLTVLVVFCLAYLWPTTADPRVVVVIALLMGIVFNAIIDYVWHFATIPLGLGLLVGTVTRLAPLPHRPPAARQRSVRIVALSTATLVLVLLLPSDLLNPAYTRLNGAGPASGDDALVFPAQGVVRSITPPEALYRRLAATREMSIELWVATADRSQDGPARIVSSSPGIIHRNLTLGQSLDRLSVRIRTTETDWNGLDAEVTVPDVFVEDVLRHLVITTDLQTTEVFVDGERWWTGPGPGGSLADWNHTYPLLLGNEESGDRPWLGALEGLAFHDRILPPEQIATAFRRGPPSTGRRQPGEPPPLALYTFADTRDRVIEDQSPRALGGDLAVPTFYVSQPSSLVETLASPGERPALRLIGHGLLFAVWAASLRIAMRPLRRATIIGALPIVGAALATTVSLVRYANGRSPSWLDAIAALIGSLVAAVIITNRQRDTASELASGARMD
jgi:hypothetical protein